MQNESAGCFKKCPACDKGKKYEDDTNYCGKCGTQLVKCDADLNPIQGSTSLAVATTTNKTTKRKSPSVDSFQVNNSFFDSCTSEKRFCDNNLLQLKNITKQDCKRDRTISESSDENNRLSGASGSAAGDIYEEMYANRSTPGASSDEELTASIEVNKGNGDAVDPPTATAAAGGKKDADINELCSQIDDRNALQISTSEQEQQQFDQDMPPASPTNAAPPVTESSPFKSQLSVELNKATGLDSATSDPDNKILKQTKKVSVADYRQYIENPRTSSKSAMSSKLFKKQMSQPNQQMSLNHIMESNDKITVNFSAALPVRCLSGVKSGHVRMYFLYDETKERIALQMNIHMHAPQNPTDSNVFIIETVVQVPRVLIEKRALLYVYFLESSTVDDNNRCLIEYEHLFRDSEEIRQLNYELKPRTENISYPRRVVGGGGGGGTSMLRLTANMIGHHRGAEQQFMLLPDAAAQQDMVEVQTHIYQFDGIILFGDVTDLDLNMCKSNQLEYEAPLRNLKSLGVDSQSTNQILYNTQLNFYESLRRLYSCLCVNDNAYRETFQKLLTKYLVEKKERILRKFNEQTMDEADYIILATSLYFSYLFQLPLINDREFLSTILLLLSHCHNITVYSNFYTVFSSEREKLNTSLKRFLEANRGTHKLSSGVCVLYFLYSINNPVKSDDLRDRWLEASRNLTQFLGYALNEPSSRVELQRLVPLILLPHANLGSLFINYFGLNNDDNLRDILRVASFESIINLLTALFNRNKITRNEREIKVFGMIVEHLLLAAQSFFGKTLSDIVPYFCKVIKQQGGQNAPLDIQYTKTPKLIELLSSLIRFMPKEWRLISKLIQVTMIYCEASDVVRQFHRSQGGLQFLGYDNYAEEQNDFVTLLDEVSKWFRKECAEDIRITFGIEDRAPEDVRRYEEMESKRQEAIRVKNSQRMVDLDEPQYVSDDDLAEMGGADDDYDDFSSHGGGGGGDMDRMFLNNRMRRSRPGARGANFNNQRNNAANSLYFGFNDEPALYNHLLALDVPLNQRKKFWDFLQERIHNRLISSEFESIVKVRAKAAFIVEKFKLKEFKIEEVLDKAIVEILLDMNKPLKDANQLKEQQKNAKVYIEKLIEIIPEKKLLQFYFRRLIEDTTQRLDKNTNMIGDYTSANAKEKSAFSLNFSNSPGFGTLSDTGDAARFQSEHQNKYRILKFIVSWPQFALLYDKQFNQKAEILDQKYHSVFKSCIDMLLATLDSAAAGSECPIYIRLFKMYTQHLSDVLRCVSKQALKQPVEFYAKLIKIRSLEIEEFESYYQALKKFVYLCRIYNIKRNDATIWLCDLKLYDDILRDFFSQIDYNLYIFKSLRTFLNPKEAKEMNDEAYKPVITYFPEINHQTMAEIKKIIDLVRGNCVLFDEYFLSECEKQFKANKDQSIKMNVIIYNVWPETVKRWKRVADSIDNGKMKLNEVYEYSVYYKTREKMLAEFKYICEYFGLRHFETRREQIYLYFRFKTSVSGAQEIEKIRQQLNMRTRFTELDPLLQISSEESKTWDLLKMDNQVRKTVDVLSKMDNEDKLKCLTAFVESHELVEWLRKNTVNIMGLKFLVELASASTNEPNADRDLLARALKDAGTAFAPLIYDLKTEDNFQTFMEHCDKVWHFLEDDKHIYDKLYEIRNKIALLDEIKQKGNVEVSSIKQAKSFNERGVYIISLDNVKTIEEINRARNSRDGNSTPSSTVVDATTNRAIGSIENVILLENCEEQDVYNKKTNVKEGKKMVTKPYTYNQLKDQQNILMLVAKKNTLASEGEDDEAKTLDYFLEIFDGITRLAELFLKLVNNGCILFNNFKVTVFCDILNERRAAARPVATITFHTDVTGHEIHDLDTSTNQSLVDLCSFMETSFKLWQDYVFNLREEHYCLNFLTINQIVYLRERLGRLFNLTTVGSNVPAVVTSDVDDFTQISYLLNNIHKNLSHDLLRHAFVKSKQLLAQNADQQKYVNYEDRIREYINRIAVDNKFRVELVKLAVDQFGIADESRILFYCMEHQHDKITEGDTDSTATRVSASQNAANFKYKLQNSWQDFMNGTNNLFTNYLSIDQLAYMLEYLRSESSSKSDDFQREKPGYLTHKGQPNLIICPLADQMSYVLSIYAESGLRSPLPSNDECLYCTNETTGEEIEIFLRIALKSNGRRIYTLINIQELNYEAANHAERCFSKISAADKNYLLVLICSSEKQSQSILVSSFFKYKIHQVIPRTIGELQRYLKLQMTSQSSKLDPEKLAVRALVSDRPGAGKSLYIKNIVEKNEGKCGYHLVTIKTAKLSIDTQIELFFAYKKTAPQQKTNLYHVDIAYEVYEGVDQFLFNLTVLGYLKHKNGRVWRRSVDDVYFIEVMPPLVRYTTGDRTEMVSFHFILNYLPKIFFRQPKKYLYDLESENAENENETRFSAISKYDQNFNAIYTDEKFQCTCYYLKLLNAQSNEITTFRFYPKDPAKDKKPEVLQQVDCLKILLEKSGLHNPTWSELNNFVTFLNENLRDCEHSPFLGTDLAQELGALKGIFLRLIIYMSYDFSLPSLNIAEETPNKEKMEIDELTNAAAGADDNAFDLNKMTIKRHWERLTHPYVLFNSDHKTFTFMGLYLDRRRYEFLDTNTDKPIPEFATSMFKIDAGLRMQLLTQRVPIFKSFNRDYQRKDRIEALRNVMGLDDRQQRSYDPDPSYELTIDNCLKMMAIYLRFRCNIPVMIMGETGCGKTRLIKYLCDLHLHQDKKDLKVLIHAKVHGGTTAEVIKEKLMQAVELSKRNFRTLYPNRLISSSTLIGEIPVSCVLFFDEANTTEAIGLIKEIMCDSTCNGVEIDFRHGLKIIAACNPYKKHTDEMIQKLEQAGLGFYKSANDTKEKLGHIPMRQLVYRVQPLPGSFLPLVWDFGQLSDAVEKVYIRQMLNKAIQDKRLPSETEASELDLISDLLTTSQAYMRDRRDECSFVSLRDIERVIKVASWFYSKRNLIFERMNRRVIPPGLNHEYQKELTPLRRSIVLALVVCYHSSLQHPKLREDYRQVIAKKIVIDPKFLVENSKDWIHTEILKVEHVFLDEIELNKNIAKNAALLENVFMMTICVELRIPLFLVGKPGSSKSLAKTIVANAMQGKNSKSDFYKNLKEAYFVNFQCSPLTTPEMIVKAFKEAARFQEGKNLETSVAVVNLDEIGLAEASESMPLKTLHPLLEEGNDTDEDSKAHEKVGVIGISNWALDPAKMNRGIFVCRSEPEISELVESAKGICNYDQHVFNNIEPHIRDMSESYLSLCRVAREKQREFFGLRDFYSLIKMIYWFCSKDTNNLFTWNKLEHAVKRNFSGLSDIDPIESFLVLKTKANNPIDQTILDNDPKCNPIDLVQAALRGDNIESNSRYLLLLTENYAILDIVQNYLLNIVKVENHNLVTIFGSSFRNDQEYTEVCRNISRIKHSMEIGNTVILLNFDNLYESLYDALNQYYHTFAGQKFVDLGLGTHRVKCSVHDSFRLIVIAEKNSVYDTKRFPIPLINRLEKHYLSATTMLQAEQVKIVDRIRQWLEIFDTKATPKDIFIGYHDDAIATIVLYLDQQRSLDETVKEDESYSALIETAKSMLLQCATSDSIARLGQPSKLLTPNDKDAIWSEYFSKQKHTSLKDMIKFHLKHNVDSRYAQQQQLNKHLLQITTNSKLLITKADLVKLAMGLGESDASKVKDNFSTCLLNSFDTQQQFINKLREFLNNPTSQVSTMEVDPYADEATDEVAELKRLLIIQIDLTIDTKHIFDLIACSRHVIVEECKDAMKSKKLRNTYVCLVINIPRENCSQFIGFQVNYWSCYHVDDIEEPPNDIPTFDLLKDKSLSVLLEESLANYKTRVVENSDANNYIDLVTLLKKCAYYACSFIKDENLKRTIERIDIFIRLCNKNKEFVEQVTRYIIDLQREKESHSNISQNWFISEVAKLDNIKKYSTLRKAAQNYIETKVSPLLGFILSVIDNYFNLDVLDRPDASWKSDLWLNLFKNKDIVKIKYDNMLSKEQKEISKFQCKSQWSISELVRETEMMQTESYSTVSELKPKLPFCWLLIITLNELYDNFGEMNRNKNLVDVNTQFEFEQYKTTITQMFVKTQFYCVIEETDNAIRDSAKLEEKISEKFESAILEDLQTGLLNDYINDFVLYNCKIKTKSDLDLISRTISNKLASRLNETRIDWKMRLPIIHYEYEKLRSKIDLYLKFIKLEPEIIKPLEKEFYRNESSNYIDIESCLLCMRKYKELLGSDGKIESITNKLKELSLILQLTSGLLTQFEEDSQNAVVLSKKKDIMEQYESLKVTQLFIENIMMTENAKPINKTNLCRSLVKQFLSGVNFKEMDTFSKLHKFMIYAIDNAREQWLDFNSESKCCKKACNDFYIMSCTAKCKVCAQCSLDHRQNRVSNCPLCKKNANGATTTRVIGIPEFRSVYDDFVDKLNGFYLNIMEMIVFNETNRKDLSEEIVRLLMHLITQSNFRTVENDVLLPPKSSNNDLLFEFKPQYSSLLLQILYKYKVGTVEKCLTDWFTQQEPQYRAQFQTTTASAVETKHVSVVNSVALTYMNSVYDALVQENSEKMHVLKKDVLLALMEQPLKLLESEILQSQSGEQYDYDTIFRIFDDQRKVFSIASLKKLAYIKYSILIFAYLLSNYKMFKMSQQFTDVVNRLDNNFNFEMKRILERIYPKTKTICYYLIKEFIRKYGSSIIKELPSLPSSPKPGEYKWIIPEGLIKNDDKPVDRYVLFGTKYTKCKTAIRETIGQNRPDNLITFIKNNERLFPYMYLALYQEVTLLHKTMNPNNIPTKLFENVLRETNPGEKALWEPLLVNNFQHNLKLQLNDPAGNLHIDLASILIQFRITVLQSPLKIVKPFIELLQNPAKMKDAFLPTMAQDTTFDIQTALIQARGHDNPKFYACPNGHPYVLFDCGRPWIIMKCHVCQADIGGTSHKLIEGNKELNVTDTTLRGYCLTDAALQPDTLQTERQMTQSAYHVIRFFLHCALYFACDKDERAVKSMMIKEPQFPKDFFWAHLNKDLALIGRALNLNPDEVYIILHSILNDVLCSTMSSMCDRWDTKDARQNWENSFSELCLQPAFREPQARIRRATEAMKKDTEDDQTSGKAELYFMAYELTDLENKNDKCIYECKNFWKFSPIVSFNTLSVELVNTTEPAAYTLLKKFIELKDKLECVFYLPDIIKLINLLKKFLSKTIFKENASTCTLRECLSTNMFEQQQVTTSVSTAQLNSKLRAEFEKYIERLQKAWMKCKAHLPQYLTKEMSNSRFTTNPDHVFNLDTRLSFFLPALYGDGFTCFALVKYLSSIHNEFVGEFISARKLQADKVHVVDINLFENPEFVIQFNTKGNLLRVITSNYKYDSANSKLIFNYEKIQRQLVENFIQGKPLINLQKLIIFEYSEEMNDVDVLIRLNKELKQELLDVDTQKAIFDDFKQINETSEALHVLKTIINFTCATSSNSEIQISEFIKSVYTENSQITQILKSKIMESCQLKHLKHIWLIIMMKRTVLFTLNGQEPFEMLEELFKQEIDEQKVGRLKFASNSTLLISMALVIYELVVLFIYPLKSNDDKTSYSKYEFHDTILSISDIDGGAAQIMFPINTPPNFLYEIFEFTEIQLCNIHEIWKHIVRELAREQ